MMQNAPAGVVGAAVLQFYRHLPFNTAATPSTMADEIRAENALRHYPPLLHLVTPGRRVLDVGCGAGWLSNTMAFHQKADVVGIDFNPVAVEFAKDVARKLNIRPRFEVADLFKFEPEAPFDIVVSLGVLHHTGDCLGAVQRLATHLRPRGFMFIGLYHQHGRRPFLERFSRMKADGHDEDTMFDEFRRLFGGQSMDDMHARSWFRDQVLHPHETQHTLAEMLPVLEAAGMQLTSASFDDYRRPADVARLLSLEAGLEDIARERLSAGHYYPGFFCLLMQRK